MLDNPATTADPVAEPAKAPRSTRADIAFTTLVHALGTDAMEATDRDDEAEFQRALAFRTAVRRMAERWAAGERSPARTASAKGGE